MGKYHGSPWGFVLGKIGDAVGGVWKGIDWVRVRVDPTQRGTYALYLALKAGTIPPESFSYKQFNLRRLIIGPLGFVARCNMHNWINPVWTRLATARHEALTGINLFIKEAFAPFWGSMPDTSVEFDPVTNSPLLTSLLVSDGDLEPIAEILTAKYTTGTGALVVTWDDSFYGNGATDDMIYCLVMRKPLVTAEYQPALYSYGTCLFGSMITRTSATGTWTLPAGLTPADLTCYLIARDAADVIGFSLSKALQVTAP